MIPELPVEKYHKTCDPSAIGCSTSAEIDAPQAIIGQERAVRSLRFGLGIKAKGFNIFAAGSPGTGRTTAIKRFVEEIALQATPPCDWCYVNNFREGYQPKALQLPTGRAIAFQADMNALIAGTIQAIRQAFESEEVAAHQERVVHDFQQQKEELLARLNEQARQEGFTIQSTPTGLLIIPLVKDRPMSGEEFMQLPPQEKEAITQTQQKLQGSLEAVIRQARLLDQSAQEALQKLDQEIALNAIRPLFEDLRAKYQGLAEVLAHLEQVQEDILKDLEKLKPETAEQGAVSPLAIQVKEPVEKPYRVNVLVDHTGLQGAPVILEPNPTYNNLFGWIEQEARLGTLITDFTLIRHGALHLANGGYLVLPMEPLMRNPQSWEGLKRALANGEIVMEGVSEGLGFAMSKNLRPQPIPLNVKVILVGKPEFYQVLLALDEQFNELFKVKADFDTQMPRNPENIQNYVIFASHLCQAEALRPVEASAIARIVEHGSRLADDQGKLSTRFGEIADVIREADYYAMLEASPHITVDHIRKAIEERFYRSSLYQERILARIEQDAIKIDISGEVVGQVNGLSVVDLGDIAFGQPSRITASIGLGREGVLDIEREANLGGPIHTKGVLILAGYLADQFAQDKPLSLSARLVFEQSYSGVDGDSASSAELYALLSALSGLPIRQGIAVTGSINQKGEVQAIGGANQKIEGFFEVCRVKGLTGEQGVLIPESNAGNLMLKEEVIQAALQGQFHIWPVKTIAEGIAVLTGSEAVGQKGVFARVNQRLQELAEIGVKYNPR